MTFGRRSGPPDLSISLQHERLRELYLGIRLLLEDAAFPGHALPVEFRADPLPEMRLGSVLSVEMDARTGMFVATELAETSRNTFRSADHDRMTDFVLAHFARASSSRTMPACVETISGLVGRTVADLEKVFILATLRRCNGNRTHTARMLGISLRTLRNKLRAYYNLGDASGY